jgi:hypothetical protein
MLLTTPAGSATALSLENLIHRILELDPVVPPLLQGDPARLRHPVVLSCRALTALHEVTLDHPLFLETGEKGIYGAFTGETESSVAQLVHHLIAIGRLLVDYRHQTHVENAVQELCSPVLSGSEFRVISEI